MPSKQKPKITLAQRLSGLQQIILAELRTAQTQLLDTINRSDYAALQSSLHAVERTLKMRELVEQLMELARAGKSAATPPSSQAAPADSAPATKAAPKQSKKAAPKQKPVQKQAKKTLVPKKETPPEAKPVAAPTTTAETRNNIPPSATESAVATPEPTKRRGPTPTGVRTSERAFYLPILQSLIAKGGEAPAADIVDDVLERMKGILKPGDFETTSTTDQPRWKVTVYLARTTMLRQGLLRKDSPRGIWAITEAGRQYAMKAAGE